MDGDQWISMESLMRSLSRSLSHSLFVRLISRDLLIQSLDPSLFTQLIVRLISPDKCTFQTGPKLDFVHLSETTNGVIQALKKSGRDFNHLVFLVDH